MFPGKLEDMLYPKIRFALENEHVTAIHGLFAHRAVGLFDYIARHWGRLVDDIETGSVDSGFKMSPEWRAYLEEKLKPNPRRAAQLRALDRATLREGMLGKIWKKLRYVRVISGNMFTVYSGKLATYLAGIPLHSYAYAASESNIGIAPRIGVTDEYALLPDVCYFEFIPEAQIGRPKDCLKFRDVRA